MVSNLSSLTLQQSIGAGGNLIGKTVNGIDDNGNQLQGIIGSFFDSMDKKAFFLMCAGVAMIPTVVFWFFNIPLRKTLHKESGQVGPVPEPATPFIEPER